MKPARNLTVAEPVHIDELLRAEIRSRDWTRVHIAGDRLEPVQISRRFGRWSWPVSRKGGA